MNFDWDEAKRVNNIQKHGIDFVDVPEVFDGDTVIAVADGNDVSAAFEADSRRSAAVKLNPSLDFEEGVDWWLLL